ncbi:MAG TPA: N-acetylmuramoyl-L-alanine amidase [Verrucomicrobiae bacterium]|nr:N-acetylmuramoyl-L-alanine amidase [Verrucomicrobiae bacterium]
MLLLSPAARSPQLAQDALPQTTPTQQSPPPQQSPAEQTATPKPVQPEYFVLIDPSHGGDDNGAVLGGKLLEKDVTLSFAWRLRSELENRGIAARLLRESDSTISLERRAEAANAQHISLYIALHAGEPGEGVRVYAPLLLSVPPAAGRFIPWEVAQSGSLARSKTFASAVARELTKSGLGAASLRAPLRPLNNILAPAIAVELAANPEEEQAVASARFQNSVAASVAAGVAKVRAQGGQQ